MTKLQELTEKICELLKGTALEFTVCDTLSIDFNGKLFRPIREAEILTTLDTLETENSNWCMESDGGIVKIDCNVAQYYNDPCWTLGKTLSEQSEEIINFLHEILVR